MRSGIGLWVGLGLGGLAIAGLAMVLAWPAPKLPTTVKGKVNWITDHDGALERARRQDKVLILHFTSKG